MRLRNQKELPPPILKARAAKKSEEGMAPIVPQADDERYITIEETLRDFHPHSLDEPFPWDYTPGEDWAWIKVPETDDPTGKRRWFIGKVIRDLGLSWDDSKCWFSAGPWRTYLVQDLDDKTVQRTIMPGCEPLMFPYSSPRVHQLLRAEGVCTPGDFFETP
ncbi:hypothetical protein NMY22_g5640 [Coprinellus aureogranulatus]|nr:hypothetical protein NMY22_g5640 [Coprinellus aureogranulatus]